MATPLTANQEAVLLLSGYDSRDGQGYGCELVGSARWKAARDLVAKELGWIEGDPGNQPPALYFNNEDGASLAREIENGPEPDYYDCGSCYGNDCMGCGFTGRIESARHREERLDYEDRKADAIRKGEWS